MKNNFLEKLLTFSFLLGSAPVLADEKPIIQSNLPSFELAANAAEIKKLIKCEAKLRTPPDSDDEVELIFTESWGVPKYAYNDPLTKIIEDEYSDEVVSEDCQGVNKEETEKSLLAIKSTYDIKFKVVENRPIIQSSLTNFDRAIGTSAFRKGLECQRKLPGSSLKDANLEFILKAHLVLRGQKNSIKMSEFNDPLTKLITDNYSDDVMGKDCITLDPDALQRTLNPIRYNYDIRFNIKPKSKEINFFPLEGIK